MPPCPERPPRPRPQGRAAGTRPAPTGAAASEVPGAEKARWRAGQRVGLKTLDGETARFIQARDAELAAEAAELPPVPTTERRRADIGHHLPVPHPPFWGRRVLEQIPVKAALAYINETMLFQVQWGFRKKGRAVAEWKRYVDAEVRPIYRELVERCEREGILQPQAVYGYWPANSDGDDLIIFTPPPTDLDRPELHGEELVRFRFPRQREHPYWCLSDFWRPLSSGVVDVAACALVTAGQRVSEVARQWFEKNEYQQYLCLHGLGVELAEALAEYIHKQARVELGAAGRDARELHKLFQQGYQGSRYSFGYPACPNLEDQVPLMKLLQPECIGVSLSEEYQLHPEQTTSALITYHPDARYFNVR